MHLDNSLALLQSVACQIDLQTEDDQGKQKICELAYESRYPDVVIIVAKSIEDRYWTRFALTAKQSHNLASIVIEEGAPSQARRFIEAVNGHLSARDWKSLVELISGDESGAKAKILLDNADFRIPKPCEVALKIVGMIYRSHE